MEDSWIAEDYMSNFIVNNENGLTSESVPLADMYPKTADVVLKSVQSLFGPLSKPKNDKQMEALMAAAIACNEESNLLIILKTGGGKSLVGWQLIPWLHGKGLPGNCKVIIISPFKVLLQQQVLRSKMLGIDTHAFDSTTPTSQSYENIFVQLEMFVSISFQRYVFQKHKVPFLLMLYCADTLQ